MGANDTAGGGGNRVDLSTINFGAVKDGDQVGTPDGLTSYDPTRDQETKRGEIAMWLVWTLTAVIGFAVLTGLVSTGACFLNPGACPVSDQVLTVSKTLLEIVLTPLIGLVGAVTGFYFGGKTAPGR